MEKIDKARYDELHALSERVAELWRVGDVDEAITLGEQYWSLLPEPKHDWEWLSQAALFFARDAALNNRPDQGRVWLERGKQAYGGDQASASAQQLIVFAAGMVSMAEGDQERAFQRFDAVYEAGGQRAFEGEDPRYWAFYAARAGIPAPRARKKKVTKKALEALAAEGDALQEKGDIDGAVEVWTDALDQLPEPAVEHPMAMWFFASIGDAQFEAGRFDEAVDATGQALLAGGTDNGFVWLRRGQSLVELGDVDGGVEALTSGYMLEGEDIFEDEDPKYEALLRERGIIPGG
ncbi:MAG: tetratricopeptide repeat protein [Arachnia sp.]